MQSRVTIGIDPGTHESGTAYAVDGKIVRASNMTNDRLYEWLDDLQSSDTHDKRHRVVIEMPQTYGGRASGSSDANVLLAIARVVGRVEQLSRFWTFMAPTPRTWKGQVPKSIMCCRVWSHLNESERAVCDVSKVSRERLAHDGQVPDSATHIMDAAGLLLWIEKRL